MSKTRSWLFTGYGIGILMHLCGLAPASWAQSAVSTSRLGLNESAAAKNSLQWDAEVSLQATEYTSTDQSYFRPGARGENYSLLLKAKGAPRFGLLRGRFDVANEYSATEDANYLMPREASVATRLGSSTWTLGRHRNTWAEWESTWQQGTFEPRFMQNRLHPISAGLTGLFFNVEKSSWSLTAGYLPVFIPDFSARFAVENSRFVSRNPWFNPPAEDFIYQEETNPIDYSLSRPSDASVVNNPGGVVKVERRSQQGSLSRLSYAYKPISQLALGFPSSGRFIVDGEMQIEVTPRVVYTRILNFDQVYKNNLWTVAASVGRDTPIRDFAPADWTQQIYLPAWVYSGLVGYRISESLTAPEVRVGFLRVDGGDGDDVGRFGNPNATKFERRFQYYNAYLAEVSKSWPLGGRVPLVTTARAIYDPTQKGGTMSFSSGYELSRNWRADLRLDFLGLLSSDKAAVNDGFLSSYRANDSVMGGMSYVF